MGKIISCLITFLILINLCYSQPTLEWVRLYPDTNTFRAYASALALDDSGNVYVAGSTDSSNRVGYCTIKYSGSGIQQWASRFLGPLYVTGLRAIALDRFSNVYVTGHSNNGSTDFDFCTIKYSATGGQQWVKYYNGPVNGEDIAQKIAVDNAGNIYVTGYSQVTGGGFVYAIVKYATDGTQLWVRTYYLTGSIVYVTGIKVDESCNVYITGDFITKAVTVKYDSSGNQLWGREYSGFGPKTGAMDIVLDRDNNVYVAGYSKGIFTSSDFLTIKYSSAGVEEWVRRYNADIAMYSSYTAYTIAIDNIGNVLVSGASTPNYNQIQARFLTIKYSNMGDTLWVRQDTTNVTYGQLPISLVIDINNNIYIAGTSWISQRYSIVTIKYDSSGFLQWRQIYNVANGTTFFRGIGVDKNFNIFLTGTGGGKMCTIKYSPLLGIININNQLPRQFKLEQNYPNPFNPKTIINFQLSMYNYVTLIIYDALGREVSTLVNEKLKPGTYEVEWDASDFSSGFYFYRLSTESYFETRKMILIK